jgi:hypothetical protein
MIDIRAMAHHLARAEIPKTPIFGGTHVTRGALL